MAAKYEYRDEVPQQIEKNREEKNFILECFSSFMEDVFGKHEFPTNGSEEQCKFHRDDMRKAFVNGWSSGVYHIKR